MAPISTSASMAWSALDYEAVLPLRMRPAASGGGGGGGHHHPVSLPLTLNSSKSYSSLCSTLSSEVGGEGGHGQGGAPYGGPPAPPAPAKPPRAVQYAPSRRAFSAAVAALHDAHTRSKSYSDLVRPLLCFFRYNFAVAVVVVVVGDRVDVSNSWYGGRVDSVVSVSFATDFTALPKSLATEKARRRRRRTRLRLSGKPTNRSSHGSNDTENDVILDQSAPFPRRQLARHRQ